MLSGSMQRKSKMGRNPLSSAVFQIEFDGAITAVDDLIRPPEVDDFIAPGFIDLQVNGFAGVDYNDPDTSHSAIAHSIQKLFSTGVTRFFPTIVTGSEQRICGAAKNMAAAKAEFERNGMPEAHAIAGFHIEGPFISPEAGPRGAHPLEHIRPPDFSEFHRWQEAARRETSFGYGVAGMGRNCRNSFAECCVAA